MNWVEVQEPMTFSYCHNCKAEVVDFGGTCKQGHAFAPSPDRATPPPPPPSRAVQMPPPPPPPVRAEPNTVWKVLEQSGFQGESRSNDPIAAFAPAPRMNWGPENEAPIVRSVRSLIDRTKSRRVEKFETQAAS
ncbi:hypothetical protein BH20ACT23_BH20ACT23_14440 [soil metagenome]